MLITIHFRYDKNSGHWVSNYLMQGLYTTLRLSLWANILAFALVLPWPWRGPAEASTCVWLP